MASTKKGGKKKQPSPDLGFLLEGQVWGSLLILIGAVTLLAMVSPRQGAVTSWWIAGLRVAVGGGILLAPFLMVGLGVWAVLRGSGKLQRAPWYRLVGAFLLFLAFVTALHLDGSITNAERVALEGKGGGMLGWALSDVLLQTFQQPLSWVVVVLAGLTGLFLLVGPILLTTGTLALVWLAQLRDDLRLHRNGALEQPPDRTGPPLPSGQPSLWRNIVDWFQQFSGLRGPARPEPPDLVIGGNGAPRPAMKPRVVGDEAAPPTTSTGAPPRPAPVPASVDSLFPRVVGGNRSWRLPNVADILDDAAEVEISRDEIRERARIIEQTLADFGVPVRVVEANQGPAVTQYGLQPGYRQRRKTTDELRREAEQLLRQRGYGTGRRPITEDLLKQVMDEEIEK